MTLVATILGSGAVFLDSTLVNVALPAIGRDLPSSTFGVLEGQSYVYNGYLLTLSALLILAGALSDYFGRRRMYLLGLGGFAVASVLCGLAPTLELLVFFRLLQGATGAFLVPGALAIITAAFAPAERGRAIGIWAGASTAAAIVGPYVGGQLVEWFSWRAAFLVNVPFLAVAIWATATNIVESRDARASGRFDWLGAAILALAVGGLTFGVIYGQQRQWQAPLAFALVAAGLVALVAFPYLMAHRDDPLVPLQLFRSRNFTVTNLSTLLIYGSLYLVVYYLPIFTQGVLGYSPPAAGVAVIPGFSSLVVFSSITGALAVRHGPRWFMAAGPVLMGVALLWFLRLPSDSPPLRLEFGTGIEWILVLLGGFLVVRLGLAPEVAGLLARRRNRGVAGSRGHFVGRLIAGLGVLAVAGGLIGALSSAGTAGYARDLLPAQIVWGLGVTLMVAPLTTALMASLPVERSGLASAINNAISRIGPQLGGAVIFVAITATFYATLGALVPGLDVTSPEIRRLFPPINQPVGDVSSALLAAARVASTDAFRLAMLIAALLALGGGVVNAAGIVNPEPSELAPAARTEPAPELARPGH